jgi:hypothetical protein
MWRPTTSTDPLQLAARRAAQTVTIVATIVFVLLVCRWRPWDLFARAGFSSDFYDEQARSFVRGRLAVRPQVASVEGFLIDGRTYLYYGPLLAVARVPFALFGDAFAGRLTRVSMIAGFVTYCTAAFALLEAARQWAAERWNRPVAAVPSPWRSAVFVGVAACSPVLFLTGWVSVYHETELWAATFAVWSTVGVLRLVQQPSRRHAAITAALIMAAILTRAPVGLGAGAGAGLVALMQWRRHREGTIIVATGCVVGFAIHSALNWIRFGSPTALPAQHQVLSLVDPTRAAWFAGNNGSFFSTRFLPTTLVQYLRPDTVRFERLIPLVRYGPLARDRGSYPVESVTPASSLTAAATLLCVLAVIGAVMVIRRRDLVWVALLVGATIAAVPTFTIGFIANRYLVDMMPLVLLPAAVAMATVAVPPALSSANARRAVRVLAVAAVVWGAWVNGALATWTQNLKEPGFTELRYRLDGAVFGDPAPSLMRIDPGGTVPRDGVVGLSGEPCVAVYVAEQGVWVNLERLDGAMQSTGRITVVPNSVVVVAEGADWTLSIESDDRTFHAVLDIAGVAQVGDDVATRSGDHHVRVVNDDVVGQFSVTVDGAIALFHFGQLAGPMLPSADLVPTTSVDAGKTLCRRLEDRL